MNKVEAAREKCKDYSIRNKSSIDDGTVRGQTKIFKHQREAARAKTRAQAYEEYHKYDNMYEKKAKIIEKWLKDEVMLSRYQESIKHGLPHSFSKVTDVVKSNAKDYDMVKKSTKKNNSGTSRVDCADSEMAQVMSKLFRQQAAPQMDIDVFTGD